MAGRWAYFAVSRAAITRIVLRFLCAIMRGGERRLIVASTRAGNVRAPTSLRSKTPAGFVRAKTCGAVLPMKAVVVLYQ